MTNIQEMIKYLNIEIKETLEKEFNIKVTANRGFFEDYRNDGSVGFFMKPNISSITSYNGLARLWNDVDFTCYVTVDKNHGGELTRQMLALEIFNFFGKTGRYDNFVILDVYNFTDDFMASGVGDVYKFNMRVNIDLLKGGNDVNNS